MTSLASTKSNDKKRECSERKLLWCSPEGTSSPRGNVIQTNTNLQNKTYTDPVPHITHIAQYTLYQHDQMFLTEKTPKEMQYCTGHIIKPLQTAWGKPCFCERTGRRKSQTNSSKQYTLQNALCQSRSTKLLPPLVALVVGRGKINQEINYYNAKIGSVAPNIKNKMKMIFL